jgi:hypothetical protein
LEEKMKRFTLVVSLLVLLTLSLSVVTQAQVIRRSGSGLSTGWEGPSFCPTDSAHSWLGSLAHPWYGGFTEYIYDPTGTHYIRFGSTGLSFSTIPTMTLTAGTITTATITTGNITTANVTKGTTLFEEGGAITMNVVNRHSDSLAYGDVVDWDTTRTTICDTTGVPNATKNFGLADTGCFGGTPATGNFDTNNRPCSSPWLKIKGITSAHDTMWFMGKDSTGAFLRDTIIILDAEDAVYMGTRRFWEYDSIRVLGAMTGDSLRIRYVLEKGVILSSGTANNRTCGVVLGRWTSASPCAVTKAGIRQQLRIVIEGPCVAKCNGATTPFVSGTNLESSVAGRLLPDGTLAVGLCSATALQGCAADGQLCRVRFHRQ